MNAPDAFQSSDSVRHAQPLRHAQTITFDEPMVLELGGRLPQVTVAYETYGQLSAERDNAVLVCHALSGDSHLARHDERDDPGWWDLMVGPGKPIDTRRYFVVCPNILGGCRGTTGPNSVNPETGRCYGPDFPLLTVGDIVAAQKRLIDYFRIERLLCVVGGSLGGHMVLTWATRYPDCVAGAVPLATSARLTSQALAFDVVGRNAILRDPDYQAGHYYENGHGPQVGLALARMLGHITYLSPEAMTQKFDAHRLAPRDIRTEFETKFAVGSYLAYQGDRFVERFDANSYLTLSMALDVFNLGETPEALRCALARSTCRWLLVSFSSDWLFPAYQSRELVNTLIPLGRRVSYCNVESDCGHDAFLLPNDLASYGELVRAFLAHLRPGLSEEAAPGADRGPVSPTSIFHHYRLDYDSILELIPRGASVLDLGCGSGGLLARLRERGHSRLMGVELDQRSLLESVQRGLDVVQGDLNQGLPGFADGQFDYVVLSQTLQAIIDVNRVLADMLRVGRYGIVSYPNLAFHRHRVALAEGGRAPRINPVQGLQWYNTPDVRFFSIADFVDFCREKAIQLHQHVALDTGSDRRVTDNPNLNADVAVAVISR
jgi:homoserine O-acetyltransferase